MMQLPKLQFKIIAILLLLSAISLNAQNPTDFIEIRGSVIDANNEEPLVFADLIVTNTNIATITNTEGEFLLKVPKNIVNATVKIQYLGYADTDMSVSDLLKKSNILLKPSFTQLEEVNITRPKNAEALIKSMLKRSGENYFSNKTTMTAFYRETIKKRRQNVSLSEAVIEIQKQAYANNKRDAINIVKVRKNTNYSKLDTLALKLQGGPFSNLYADIIKYPQYIFTEDNLSQYIFTFDKSTQINDRLVYVVNFKQKPELKIPLYYGKLFIDSKNLALTSAIYSLNLDNKVLASELFIRKKPNKVRVYPTEANYRVNYRVHEGKWYYSYSNILLSFKVNWKGRLFNSYYSLNSEMAVTNWENASEKFSKPIDKNLILKPTSILIDEATGFSDPDFWGEYNIIEPEKSIESAIKKINKQLEKSES
ncbi:carboxypeptidase-like regulatory domain-containing protein [Hanstruepera ponticola]|uniref:carboxypeptidase-like regulatory domain-containing protein n=1 Tax=Hanstruepera ponticola TaxID=2042995 RepID=UPI001F3F6DB6|nr:carboxypeptidase-like regulatory domain-containing protein [Hanstruepera ponticola]